MQFVSLQYEVKYCCLYDTMTSIILYGAEIFWEKYELCGTAVTHHSEKLGIVLSLECSVIMTSKKKSASWQEGLPWQLCKFYIIFVA